MELSMDWMDFTTRVIEEREVKMGQIWQSKCQYDGSLQKRYGNLRSRYVYLDELLQVL